MLLWLAACDPATDTADVSSSCGAGSAAIGISDGLIAPLCGCSGTTDGWRTFDAGINCTVTAGTTVSFYYLSTTLSHQIRSTATSARSFAPSPVSDPAVEPVIRTHAVTLSVAGTYTFTDSFDARLAATLTVTP